MRRKEPLQTGGNRSLIATRTCQQQQRRLQGSKSHLPRSYSSPASETEQDVPTKQNKYIRSYSSPEPKPTSSRRSSIYTSRPKLHSSRSEIDSDVENYEQFEEGFLDIDADVENPFRQFNINCEVDEPKKVITTLLPGSGLQKVKIKPVQSSSQIGHGARDLTKTPKIKGIARFNFRPLIVRMPSQALPSESQSASIEELQTSPPLEDEVAAIEKEMVDAEFLLDKGVTIATEESDSDTIFGENTGAGGRRNARYDAKFSFCVPAPTPTRLERPNERLPTE
ncbi:unnamed protein product [Colias eurytheme]|nr:unnamed protein product [Colias eurytheme]